ncbi:MAG: hypothetical protein ACFFB5_22020 [Promethearchaeota archaeon]
MNGKPKHTMLLTSVIAIFFLIGGVFVIKTSVHFFPIDSSIDSNLISNEANKVIPQNYTRREVMNVQQDACCGHTDTTPPTIQINSPANNSFVLGGTIIDLKIFDDNPFYDYEAKQVLYRWGTDQSNTTLDSPHNVVISNDIGTYVLYVYAEDNDDNWGSAIFSFTVTLTYNPPTIEIIFPSTSNQTLTGMKLFSANVNDDNGILDVKIQIDVVVDGVRYPGRTYPMYYNETSSYYDMNFNVSSLTNGYHWLVTIATDLDGEQHIVTKEIDFTVIGGIGVIVGGDPPEWDQIQSVLPKNVSKYIEEDKFSDYEAEVGDVYFKLVVSDEVGIAAVDLTVYALDDFDNSTGEFELGDARIELSESLSQIGTNGNWLIYEYTWDSTSSLDNYYLCKFEIQDEDTITNRLIISIVLEIDNVVDDQPTVDFGSPGFEVEILILALSSLVLLAVLINRNHTHKND